MTEDERLGSIVKAYRSRFGEVADVVFDCGTRDGDDAAYLKRELKAKRVFAIDALPSACQHTQEKHPDLIVLNTALSNYVGTASFTEIVSERKDHAGSSSFVLAPGWDEEEKRQVETSVTTMSSLIEELGLADTMLDVVKVDLEGFSYEFLEGMGDYIHNAKVMHLETETFHRHQGHHGSEEVFDYMSARGFSLYERSYEWGPSIEDQLWVNDRVE
jgi:FkbM family methyltransferase